MANTTLSVAGNASMSQKLVAACAGPEHLGGATVKAFTATAGTGNAPVAGFTLDLSALFPTKVLMAVVSPLYDPAITTGDTAYMTVYVPAATGNPATGRVHVFEANVSGNAEAVPLTKVPDDTDAVTGFVVNGFAIGY